jgi:hypothetical protein
MGIFERIKASISPSIVLLTLDVREVVEKDWKESERLSETQKRVLSRMADFLRIAEKGQEILHRAEGNLVADVVSINHYGYVKKALGDRGAHEIEKSLKATKDVVQELTQGVRPFGISPQDWNTTRQFFKALSELSIHEFATIRW